MHTVVFDIETNAIKCFRTLLGLKKIHCVALSTNGDEPRLVTIEEGLEELRLADVIIGHNIQEFDVRAIQRLYPEWEPTGCVRDTLVMSRMVWPDIANTDWQNPDFPKKFAGRHSLKAWGYRLGMHKGDYGEQDNCWDEYTDEMGEYCVQDVRVTLALWNKIQAEDVPENPTVLEHEFAGIISQQERNGIGFNVDAARDLHGSLLAAKDEVQKELKTAFPPQTIPMKTPLYYYDPETDEKYDKKKDCPAKIRSRLLAGERRVKTIPFNPGSRDQIAKGLIEKHGWEPEEFTPEGRPKIDETVLKGLEYPECKPLIQYLLLGKRLGQVAEGREAWIKLEQDSRIYGRVNPCGAVSTRCTHSKPNVAQVPRVSAPWGLECRSLFCAPEGYRLVGADMSGLELRCLAHYTFRYDDGLYRDAILEGDIHEINKEAAGLDNRDQAKTFVYALLYGAGAARIGKIVGGTARDGSHLKTVFFNRMPALKKLKDAVEFRADKLGVLKAIDGRTLRVRSKHSALNLLLQSAGSIAMKKATCLLHSILRTENMGDLDKVKQVAHIHDEIQLEARYDFAQAAGRAAVRAMEQAGEELGFKCPLTGEYNIGSNWAETH